MADPHPLPLDESQGGPNLPPSRSKEDIALMAHLLRRAGFGAGRDELEAYAAKGYEAAVEELLNPQQRPDLEEDLALRYHPSYYQGMAAETNVQHWIYRMINSPRQLEEKMTLFWHMILCAGYSKVDYNFETLTMIDMFRQQGMGNLRDLLVGLSGSPGMLFYLDNTESHKGAVNENYGRELLELFSMGVGKDEQSNYSEEDVKVCSQAFTGWTVATGYPTFPYGSSPWRFLYDPTDHDDSVKTFLGETGKFNGEDVVDIICRQPGTARFISRHLYNFFVADEPQVPAWQATPPRDLEAVKVLEKAYFDSHYDIKAMLRALFNADFFKQARFTKMKNPAEVVVGTLRLVGEHREIKPELLEMVRESRFMGMDLMNPPTVEGWHTGAEWIDSGTLVERINFVSGMVGNTGLPGVQSIVNRLMGRGEALAPEELVDGCLELMGSIEVSGDVRKQLTGHARKAGVLRHKTAGERAEFTDRVVQMLQMLAATPQYQFS